MLVTKKKINSFVGSVVLSLVATLFLTPRLIAGPFAPDQMFEDPGVESFKSQIDFSEEDISKEKLIVDLLGASVVQLETNMLNLRKCTNQFQTEHCENFLSYCLASSENVYAIQKTLDMIQAHVIQPVSTSTSRKISSIVQFDFDSNDLANYKALKFKYKFLDEEKNKICK